MCQYRIRTLVRTARDQARACLVKRRAEHARLGIERAGLHRVAHRLERHTRRIVKQLHRPIVCPRKQDAVRIARQRVHNALMRHVRHQRALRTPPPLDVVAPRRAGRKRKLVRRQRQGSDRLFVVRQRRHTPPCRQVPQLDRGVHTARNHLRITLLTRHARHRAAVPTQHVDLRLRPHVPHTRRRIPSRRHQHVERRVQTQRIDARQVAIVLPHDLVRLQVPALDKLVLARRKQIRMPVTDGQATHRRNVARQRQLQLTRRHVPDLDNAVARPRREPLIVRVHSYAPHPAEMARHDTHQLPRRMVRRLRLLLR